MPYPVLPPTAPDSVPRNRGSRLVAAVLAVLMATALVAVAGPAPRADAATPSGDAWAFLTLTNQARAGAGLPPLRMQQTMVDISAGWTAQMASARRLSHNPNLRNQVPAAFPDWRGYAENVGVGGDVSGLQSAFMNSPEHRANILGPYNYVGISTQRDSAGNMWVTLDFLKLDRVVPTMSPMSASVATSLTAAAYHDFFHRLPTSSELFYWVNQLASGGVDQGGFLATVVTSPEWVSQLVAQLYRDTLGRSPDSSGLSYWVGRIRAGMTPAAAAANFYGSPEYYSSTGGTASSWVRALYTKLLNRSADSSGLSYWTGRLNRGEPRDRIAYEFYQSAESRSRRVRGLYAQLLGRSPDAGGLSYWIGQLGDGNDLRLAMALANSAEYVSRARALYPA